MPTTSVPTAAPAQAEAAIAPTAAQAQAATAPTDAPAQKPILL